MNEREPQSEALEALAALEAMPANRAAAEMKAEIIRAALTRTPPQQGRVIGGSVSGASVMDRRGHERFVVSTDPTLYRLRATLHIHEPSEENDG